MECDSSMYIMYPQVLQKRMKVLSPWADVCFEVRCKASIIPYCLIVCSSSNDTSRL